MAVRRKLNSHCSTALPICCNPGGDPCWADGNGLQYLDLKTFITGITLCSEMLAFASCAGKSVRLFFNCSLTVRAPRRRDITWLELGFTKGWLGNLHGTGHAVAYFFPHVQTMVSGANAGSHILPNFRYFCNFSILCWGFRELWGCCEVGHAFLCRMNLELWRNSVWGSTYGGCWVSKTFFVYN